MRESQCLTCLADEKNKEIAKATEAEAAAVAEGEQERIKSQLFLSQTGVKANGSCLPFLHSWRGCICVRCGKPKEDGQHDWWGCTCKLCGEVRDTGHAFYPVSVGGNMQRCVICGKSRDLKAEAAKKKRDLLFWSVALLILFPPAGIFLTWWFQKGWPTETKKKISIASGIWFIAVIIAITAASSAFTDNGAPAIVEGHARVPAESGHFTGRDYQAVVAYFKAAGFTNITTEGLGDLITGWLVRDGSVRTVYVDGVSFFETGRIFPIDAEIIITHHSFP